MAFPEHEKQDCHQDQKGSRSDPMLADLRSQAEQHIVPAGAVARIYMALGDQDHAFELLGQAAERHDQMCST